jgi:hypothetical protein
MTAAFEGDLPLTGRNRTIGKKLPDDSITVATTARYPSRFDAAALPATNL